MAEKAVPPRQTNVEDNRVWDRSRHNVEHSSAEEAILTSWPSSPVIAVQGFNAPYGIAIDVNSSLYVADTNNHQSEEFLLNSYIVPTNIFGIGNLTSPKGIAVDPNLSNNIYITDSVLNEVFEFAQ